MDRIFRITSVWDLRGARRELRELLVAKGDVQSDFIGAEIVFGELAATAFRHAAGPIDLLVEWPLDRPIVRVVDVHATPASYAALPFDPACEDRNAPGIIRRLAHRIDVRAAQGGAEVRAILPVWRPMYVLP